MHLYSKKNFPVSFKIKQRHTENEFSNNNTIASSFVAFFKELHREVLRKSGRTDQANLIMYEAQAWVNLPKT